jgi:hypothetical protein
MQQMVKCPNCGTQSAGLQFCTTCGAKLPAATQQQVWESQSASAAGPTVVKAVSPRKYGALKAVATVYRIIGWVVMVGGSLFSIALAVIGVQGTGELSKFIPWGAGLGMVGIAVVGVVVSILFGLFLLAFSDLCYVLMNIESNTKSEE